MLRLFAQLAASAAALTFIVLTEASALSDAPEPNVTERKPPKVSSVLRRPPATPTRPRREPTPEPVEENEKEPTMLPRADLPRLTMQMVVAAVARQQKQVAPCLRAAVSRGELARQKPHRLEIEWRVTPTGRVTEAKVNGPTELAHGSLAQCLVVAMKRWRFPESAAGATIKRYPFGPFTIK